MRKKDESFDRGGIRLQKKAEFYGFITEGVAMSQYHGVCKTDK